MVQRKERTPGSPAMTAPLAGLPLPDLDRLPDYERGFWEGTRERQLRIQRCTGCTVFRHLPTPMCPDCHSLDYEWAAVSGRGTVYSFVIARHPVHPAIRALEQLPYNVCVVELEEQAGLRIVSNVLDVAPEDIRIGMPVEVRFMPAPDDPAVVLAMFAPV